MTDGRKRPDVKAMIAKAARETREAFENQILAPVVPGCHVRVRIDGLISDFEVDDKKFLGWAILKPIAPGKAEIMGNAGPAQIKAYFELLPQYQLIMLKDLNNTWWALPAHTSDRRISVSGPVPVRLATRIASFDTVETRFDGASFWFESIARRRNPVTARTLRDELEKDTFPEDLHCPEMTPQERLAFSFLFYEKHPDLIDGILEQEAPSHPDSTDETFDYDTWLKEFKDRLARIEQNKDVRRIARALNHAGARLVSYWRNSPDDIGITVNMTIDGEKHIARVRESDLTVINAGICLSGEDDKFDLTSLVSVLREYSR